MSQHTIQVEIEVEDREDCAYPMIEITFDYSRGSPTFTPRGSLPSGSDRGEYGPIDPPEPPQIQFREARLIAADGVPLDDKKVQELAEAFLETDAGYDYAADCAETDLLATRAAHLEYRREQ